MGGACQAGAGSRTMAADRESDDMSTVDLRNTEPIAIEAFVTAVSGGGYAITIECDDTITEDIVDSWYEPAPATITVNVTSTTVPSGYHLGATGDGSWTTVSSSSLTGAFTVSPASVTESSFTIVLYSGTQVVARHDPRLTIKRMSGELPPEA